MRNNVNKIGCPVCGYSGFAAFDENGLANYEICPCCSNQSGYDYGEEENEERFVLLRQVWYKDKDARWLGSADVPANWDADRQLKLAGLLV
jgi:hypothetical protein